jgi:hypothetical protein
VLVGGKIDGKAYGKVIEVKNRVRRFLSPLPKVNFAQLQTNLFIIDWSTANICSQTPRRPS